MKRWGWKRICLTAVAGVAALFLLAGAALAVAVFTVDTSVRQTVYAPGDTVNVDVTLSPAEGEAAADLGGMQLALSYDAALFEYAGVSAENIDFIAAQASDEPSNPDNINSFLVAHDAGNGTVQLVYVNAALAPKAGETLFTVNFKVKESAELGAQGSFTIQSEGAYSTAAQLVAGTDLAKTLTVTVQESAGLLGDVNGDGKIDTKDSVFILQSVVGLRILTDEQTFLADVNEDGKVDTKDSVFILQRVVGLRDENWMPVGN
mgnify:CR=1 FL=1